MSARNPRTAAQWQQAVDAADACLALDSARKYGLVTGGPAVDVDRCVEILEQGKRRGLRPNSGNVERLVAQLNAEAGSDVVCQRHRSRLR